jgi:cold shock CspA family protein
MTIPLEVAYEGGLAGSLTIETRIAREAAKLERFAGRINKCEVAVSRGSAAHRHGDLFRVRIRVTVARDGEVVVDRNPDADHAHEDVQVAIRDAFNALRRRLQDRARRHGGKVKRHEAPPQGRVTRIQREDGYGFILAADGHELYFHRNAVLNGGFNRLAEGAEVRFTEAVGEKGPQASTVRLVRPGASASPSRNLPGVLRRGE